MARASGTGHLASAVATLSAGLIAGVLAVTFMYSYAAVVLGPVAPSLVPRLTGHFMIGAAIVAPIIGFTSQFRTVVAAPQDTPTAVLAVVALGAVAGAAGADPEALFATVLALIVVSTGVSGALFWLIGRYRLAVLGQYVPFPVVAGFLAATGWLLVKASFSVMAGVALDLGALSEMWALRQLWVAGVVMAIAMHWIGRRHRVALLVPGALVVATLTYHGVRWLLGISRDEAITDGWLAPSLGTGLLVEPVSLDRIEWKVIADETFGIVTVLLISLIGVLLNLTALSSDFGEDVDVDREMRFVGLSNILAAGTGSTVGFHYVSLSTMGRSMGTDNRLVGAVVAVVCVFAATVGADGLSYIPQFVLGGTLLYIGLGFIHNWFIAGFRRLVPAELAIIVIIMGVVEVVGFLEGIAVGLLASSVHFIVTYSRTGAIRHVFTGREVHSPAERPTAHQIELARRADGILLVKLQGHIFFASTVGLVDSLTDRISSEGRPVTHLIVDFEQVTGIDASGYEGINKLTRVTRAAGVEIVNAAVPPGYEHQMAIRRNNGAGERVVASFDSGESALEWCEDELLRRAGLDPRLDEFSLDYTLREMFEDATDLDTFRLHLEPIELAPGDRLTTQALSGSLHFVESGWLEMFADEAETTRVRRAGPGSVIGIASFFRRGGSVSLVVARAETDSVVHRLTNDGYFRLVSEHPKAAHAFQRHALVALSDRYANLLSSYELVMRSRT